MNVLDGAVFFAMMFMGMRSLRRGFWTELLEAVVAGTSVVVGWIVAPSVADTLARHTGLPYPFYHGTAFLTIAVTLTAIGFYMVGRFVGRPSAPNEHRGFVHVAGFAFGVAKTVLYASLIAIALSDVRHGFVTDTLDGSLFARTVMRMAPAVYGRIGR